MKGATIIYREGCKEDHEEIERKKTVEKRGNYLCAIEKYTHFLYATGPTCHTHTKKFSIAT
jgi:hypothetical protein